MAVFPEFWGKITARYRGCIVYINWLVCIRRMLRCTWCFFLYQTSELTQRHKLVVWDWLRAQYNIILINISAACSGKQQRNHLILISLLLCAGNRRLRVDSNHEGPVMREAFSCRGVAWSSYLAYFIANGFREACSHTVLHTINITEHVLWSDGMLISFREQEYTHLKKHSRDRTLFYLDYQYHWWYCIFFAWAKVKMRAHTF